MENTAINANNLPNSEPNTTIVPDFDSKIAQESTPEETVKTFERQWRNAGRPEQRRPLKSSSKIRLWSVSLAGLVALFWVFSLTLNWLIYPFDFISVKIQSLGNQEYIYHYTISPRTILIFLVIWLVISPWVLDAILKKMYQVSPLLLSQLKDKSPESVKLLTKYTQQHSIPLPSLKILPTSCPVAISYGNHPRNTCIVISRGLLTQLTDEEIATVYGTQLGHLINKDVIWMSAIVALVQIPYLLHSYCAAWANGRKVSGLSKMLLILSTLWYGVYQFWRLPALWLSRQRILDSDRQAVKMTKNPNALSRGLLKITIGISRKIQQQGYTPQLIDSFGLLLPIEPRSAINLGSLPPDVAYESVLGWDFTNPYRHWLGLFDSHPLMGERLYLLGRYAKFWNIESELDIPECLPSGETFGELCRLLINSYQALPIFSAAFLFALGFGGVLRSLIWLTGKLSITHNFKPLAWMDAPFPLLNAWPLWVFILCLMIGLFLVNYRHPSIFAWVIGFKVMLWVLDDWSGGRLSWFNSRDPFFEGCCLIAFSFSLIMMQNRYFPHPKNTFVVTDPSLVDLLSDPEAVPGQPELIRISGMLLGHPKINHWLGQDLCLQTSTGLIKLQFLGLLGNVIPWSLYPKQLVKKPVTVQGWLRRGSFPVIEVDGFKSIQGNIIRSGATHFIFILIIISALWGAYLIRNN